ncbi:hypothetical protein E4T47_02371 [Aureobasidium subglaciale]|nr:hypothetical protein E4T47_02371 [Aureobasidium subglaciale]
MMGGPTPNSGTPNNASSGDISRQKLNTYIYDYFLKHGNHDVARAILKTVDLDLDQNQSPDRKDINGVGDSIDPDSKDKKPDDLPSPNVPAASDGSFLYDWWHQFWECFNAQHGRGNNTQTAKYLSNVQARMANERQRLMRVDPQMQANMAMRPGMVGPSIPVPPEMAKKFGLQPGRQPTQQQVVQMQQQMRMQQMAQLQQNAMQREGSTMEQRPTSPGAGDVAPSPKRQRLDGNFNGAMGPMGRGQPQGMPGQQMQMPNPQAKAMQQVYANSMRQHMQSAMDSNVDKGLMPNGTPQMPQDPNAAEFFNPQMRPMPGQAPPNANSNHALQDYQMQLMLLEQQNKKRLLMARQEQDNMTNGPNGPVPASGQPQNFAPAMSPSNSRAGPSPGPNEQMRRGTPKMAPGVVPSPTADGGMPGRASPAPGQFDPNNAMNPAMFPMGMMKGPNGQMMQPPSSHPAFNQMNQQQQMEMFRQSQARNGQAQMANGFMPQGPNMMGGQPPPQPPNMTPQQRNAAMPPPPAPGNDGPRAGTGPSSPSQNQAPPTPSQANKPNTKSKKDSKASANKVTSARSSNAASNTNRLSQGGKKGTTGATPQESTEQPPTPTPAPPITPQPTSSFPPKPSQAQNQPQGGQSGMPGQQNQGGDMSNIGAPFGSMDDNFSGMALDFGMDGPDVLDNFDFDSFLTTDGGADSFNFDPSGMNFGTDGGLEAGGDV